MALHKRCCCLFLCLFTFASTQAQSAITKFQIIPEVAQIGEEVKFTCDSTGVSIAIEECTSPSSCTAATFAKQTTTSVGNGLSSTATKVVDRNTGLKYKCVAGTDSLTRDIKIVEYTVQNDTLTPSDSYGSDGFQTVREANATLKCSAKWVGSSNGTLSTMLETHDNEPATSFTKNGDSFVIQNPTIADMNEYLCHAVDSSGNKIYVSPYPVMLNGGIFTKKTYKPKNLMEGDNALLNCEAYGYPYPSATWMQKKDGVDAVPVSTDSRFNLKDFEFESGFVVFNGTIKIDVLDMDDTAEYLCDAHNDFGNSSITIDLRVRDKYAAVWPFLGIVAEVIVLCIIIFVCEKRRAKKAANVSKTEHDKNGTETKLNTDTAGEVRQRK